MALFRRKKDDSVLPEVDKYYEGERRDRPVMAWLLALLSIAVVALVIVGLFLGGRWAYNKVAGNNDEEVATAPDINAPSIDGGPENQVQEGSEPSQPQAPAGGSEQSGTGNNQSGSTAPSQPPAQTSTPSTAALPGTGPEGVVAAFLTTSVVAGGAYHFAQRRSARKP